mmetsp:Transcript_32500/g.63514  ORF Transcript_32500/g.63514 Transcript_32500/m.63514 type:complete len:240 (+) Transcript_32500:101-820(+)
MSATKKITYYFDCISPYTAFAWFVLQRYKAKWSSRVQIEYKPMFLGAVMHATKNVSPAMAIPQKATFVAGDIKRNCGLFGAELLPMPSNFFTEVAKKVILIQRVIASAILHGVSPSRVEAIISNFTHAIHLDKSLRSEDNELKLEKSTIASCLAASGLSGEEAKKLMASVSTAAVKNALKANTKEALKRGVFGSPSFWIEGGAKPHAEPFLVFGSDRFEQIAHILGLEWSGVNPIYSNL